MELVQQPHDAGHGGGALVHTGVQQKIVHLVGDQRLEKVRFGALDSHERHAGVDVDAHLYLIEKMLLLLETAR